MPDLAALYSARAEAHRQSWRLLERRSRLLSNLRGLTFATWVLGWGFALFGSAGMLGAIIGAVALAGFLGLIVYHSRVIAAENTELRWVGTNEDAVARVSGNAWHGLASTGERFRLPAHPYADDLDLFGRGSLFQRICVAKTLLGQSRLAELLLHPASTALIQERQRVVRELSPRLDFRQELEVLARATLHSRPSGGATSDLEDLESLFTWGEATERAVHRAQLLWAVRLLPLATTVFVLLAYLGLLPSWLALLSLVGHLGLLFSNRGSRVELTRVLATSEKTVLAVEPIFSLLERVSDGPLRTLAERELDVAATPPSRACRSLRRIAGWFEFRHNGLIYPFVNLYLLWDLQCIIAFEQWREQHGKKLRRWFRFLGEVEALSSLAGFHHDEPNTCFADIVDEDKAVFEAKDLGHPLIDERTRVRNDVPMLSQGHGLLVTGSNMSGKSTFLRAMGLAAVLGLAGGPVCAARLRLSPLFVVTSMRISDSLSAGVSHFYAELHKLKAVVEATAGERPVFFLLDEILHGTNSRERRIGARWILSKLLRTNSVGAVSTHDLALCELSGDLVGSLRLVHFREDAQDGRMTFDYLLREGPVTEGNALRLMRSLGLQVPLQE